jgi:hypothetical protein
MKWGVESSPAVYRSPTFGAAGARRIFVSGASMWPRFDGLKRALLTAIIDMNEDFALPRFACIGYNMRLEEFRLVPGREWK